jgi:ribosomal protein S18 acetylase RimI-like enzyme
MSVRPRRDEDLGACATVLREVHDQDRYPKIWPPDAAGWLAGHDALAAWVGVRGPAIVGHVLLHEVEPERTWPEWLAATGRGPDRLTVMSRFFVAPGARGTGAGLALMDEARAYARQHGRHLVLEVADDSHGAIAFYERHGWVEVGSGVIRIASGRVMLPVRLLVDRAATEPSRCGGSPRMGTIARPSGE